MTYEQWRTKRYGDLTDAGKKSYNTDAAYKQRRETQWQGEYAQLQRQPATTPSATPGGYNPGGNFTAPNASAQGQSTPGTTDLVDSWNDSDLSSNPILIKRPIPKLLARPGTNPDGVTTNAAVQMNWLNSLHGSDLTHLQDQLVAAGLLTEGKYGRGVPADKYTASAYLELLHRAYYSNSTIDEVLHESTNATSQYGSASGGSTAAKQGRVWQPVAREDVEGAGQSVGPGEIGRSLSDAEVNNYTSAYQAMQDQASQQQYAAEGSGLPGGPGGKVNPLPSVSAFLLDRIRKDHPTEYRDTQYRNAVHTVIDLINTGGLGT